MPAFFFFQNHLPNLPFQQILCKNNCVIPLWQSLCALCWDHWLVSLALPLRCCFRCVSCVKFSEETWGTTVPDKYCRYDLISHSQGYSLYSSCHQQLTRHFKCHVSLPTLLQILSLLSISHYLQDLLFISHFFYNPKRASAAQVSWWLPRTRAGCFCSPISSSFTSELCFQIVLMQIEQFNTSFSLHFSVIPLLLFPACLPDLVLASTSKRKWWNIGWAL